MNLRLDVRALLLLLLALPVAGCPGSSDAPPGADAGPPALDAGPSAVDAPALDDAGPGSDDTGPSGADGGPGAADARPPGADAGPSPSDAGQPAGCVSGCSATEYCDLCASPPVCETRPPDEGRICPAIYMPVCGCDGVTYSNACALASAGIASQHPGECDAPPPPPGDCVTDDDCSAGEYCATCRSSSGGVTVCLPVGTLC